MIAKRSFPLKGEQIKKTIGNLTVKRCFFKPGKRKKALLRAFCPGEEAFLFPADFPADKKREKKKKTKEKGDLSRKRIAEA
ncbi:MAG: hypothetical protein J6A21_01780 [Lentisphaeria bacterium]|nr:hypothetical protein [Lentisphaeria bacterium]